MNKEFVPYEQALALKELGFDEPCLGWYAGKDREVYYNQDADELIPFVKVPITISKDSKTRFLAPLYQQAFRWFREKYQLAVDIRSEHLGYYTSIVDREKMMRIVMKPVNIFETYEEAEQACLDKLIEIVKTNETLH